MLSLPLVRRRPSPSTVIAVAQLLGTSLWFSANSAAQDLARAWHIGNSDIGWLTSAVQTGFITGTLFMALAGLADRFRASRIFAISTIAGAFFNACFAWFSHGLADAMLYRFLVGLSLAGIYPLGMKLIVSWEPRRTGMALAQLVAMLTLGTALPHLLRQLGAGLPWQTVILASSVLALGGGGLIYALGEGPHLPGARGRSHDRAGANGGKAAVLSAFKARPFRAAAWGYFGHMWELYAFWTVVPVLISHTTLAGIVPGWGVSGMSFVVIAAGALGCMAGGMLTRRLDSAPVALGALFISGTCGAVFALSWSTLSPLAMAILMLVWGASVVADSPQFSALSARSCPADLVGSALAIQNAIGFAITVVSISLCTDLLARIGLDAVWLLVPGPMVGLAGYTLTIRGGQRAMQT
ncbi:MFS transporter [Bordetella sp. FB-8]|uniref:MFS transporter n=1 Tax=Bordetella sp. FB-8 TaxID=1159870 RepID=UPI0003686BED|nr:MFS transporter [Bordetella sp. FB-8]